MAFTLRGVRTIGGAAPALSTAVAALDASVNVSLGEVQAKLSGAIAAMAAIEVSPPTLASQLQGLLAAAAALQAMIALGLTGGSVNVAAMVAAIAELQASLGKLQASLALSASLGATLGTAGIYVYEWSGRAGDAVPGGLPGIAPDSESWGVLNVGATSAAISALATVFG